MRFSIPYKIYWTLVTLWLLFLISGALFIRFYPFEEYIRCWGDPWVINANTIAIYIGSNMNYSSFLCLFTLLIGAISFLLSYKWKRFSSASKHLIVSSLFVLTTMSLIPHFFRITSKASPREFGIIQTMHCDSEGKPDPTLY